MLDDKLFRSAEINCWDQLVQYLHNLPKTEGGDEKKWIFRGQKRIDMGLKTSLERALESFPLDESYQTTIPKIEKKILREFKRRLHHYFKDVPKDDDIIEWLALMQHYGAPTRLLDWTYSFFNAAFFALEKAGEKRKNPITEKEELIECEVWAIDAGLIYSKGNKKVLGEVGTRKRDRIERDSKIRDLKWVERIAIIKFLIEKPQLLVCTMNPFRLNERLTIQQGVFLFPGDISKSFEENLSPHNLSPDDLVRFKITSELSFRREALLNLHRMNISRATLFPGLGGFSESLRTRLAFPKLLG